VLEFRRVHSADRTGRAILDVAYPDSWSIDGELPEPARADESRVTWDLPLRKHVPVEFVVGFGAG